MENSDANESDDLIEFDADTNGNCAASKVCVPEEYFEMLEKCKLCNRIV